MRIGIISDVHGNLVGLEACLARLQALGCEELVSLGDTYGYYPDGRACFDRLAGLGAHSLMGNHEAMLLGLLTAEASSEDTLRHDADRESLTPQRREELSALLPWHSVQLPAVGSVLMVHGTPQDPLRGYAYPDSDVSSYADLGFDLILMGNTHRPFSTVVGRTRIVNVGSAGQPRDVGHRACVAVLDTRTGSVELVAVELDVEEIRRCYPDVHPSVLALLERTS